MNLLQPEPKGDARDARRGTVCRVSLRVVQLTPCSTLTPDPSRDLSWEGSCLTQNGAWFRSQKDGERCTEVEGGSEGAAHRGPIYPLSDFSSPPLRSLLFCLHRNYWPFFQCISLSSLSSSSVFGMATRHHQGPPSPRQVWIHGSRDQQDSGRENTGRGFNESEASSPREKCMQMICTRLKEPGWAPAELLLSSEEDEQLRSEEWQPNVSSTFFFICLFYFIPSEQKMQTDKQKTVYCRLRRCVLTAVARQISFTFLSNFICTWIFFSLCTYFVFVIYQYL